MNQPQMNIDFKTTTAIKSEEGNQIFQQGFLLRKVSRFVTNQPKDAIVPVAIFFDIKTGKPVKETLPPDLYAEFGYSNDTPTSPLSVVK